MSVLGAMGLRPPSDAGATIGWLAVLLVIAFLLGSIPWGVIISRVFYRKDIRDEGSGNIGTANAMRSLGRVGGGAVFVLDFVKGCLSGLVAWQFAIWFSQGASDSGTPAIVTMVGFASSAGQTLTAASDPAVAEMIRQFCGAVAFFGCILGHIFSPWLKFKGGKGIAVGVGCLLFFLGPVPTLIAVLAFVVLVVATRYVSVGSLAAAVASIILCFVLMWGNVLAIVFGVIALLAIIWAHRGNIGNLREGTERRIGDRRT